MNHEQSCVYEIMVKRSCQNYMKEKTVNWCDTSIIRSYQLVLASVEELVVCLNKSDLTN